MYNYAKVEGSGYGGTPLRRLGIWQAGEKISLLPKEAVRFGSGEEKIGLLPKDENSGGVGFTLVGSYYIIKGKCFMDEGGE